jgi:hypothetical protein
VLDNAGLLAGIRLTEYYELVDKGVVAVGGITALSALGGQMAVDDHGARNGKSESGTTLGGSVRAETALEDTTVNEATADANADRALDYFTMEDANE